MKFILAVMLSLASLPAVAQSIFNQGPLADIADVVASEPEAHLQEKLQAIATETGHSLSILYVSDWQSHFEGEDFDAAVETIMDTWSTSLDPEQKGLLIAFDLDGQLARIRATGNLSGPLLGQLRGELRSAMADHLGQDDFTAAADAGADAFAATVMAASNADPASSRVTPFAARVLDHVLMHEAAHALIRELELPVLGNEEVMADAFATLWFATRERDVAQEVVLARVQSWMLEDAQTDPSRYDFKSEHPLDVRRAYQAACLLYGADPQEWEGAVAFLEFTERDLADCSDTAPDQIAGWVRILEPHLMAARRLSRQVEVIYGEGVLKDDMIHSGVVEQFADRLRAFDWPRQITVHFDACDQGASWNRKTRTILLCEDLVFRIISQGQKSN
ncbi:MAG: DUF4344 domain-containing metallopeptidase [Pseudomonadota bacterium]